MRDASGNLVEVRVQEPWALHLLTADGTNAALEDAETMKSTFAACCAQPVRKPADGCNDSPTQVKLAPQFGL